MNATLCLFFALLIACSANAQSPMRISPDAIPETREIVLNSADTIWKIRIFVANPAVSTRADRFYAWYQKQLVLHTQGAWSGKLLQGPYEAYYPNHNLLEQGQYEQGLKVGTWERWYPNGALQERTQWKHGRRHGAYERFDATGRLAERGTHRHGQRQGPYWTYTDGQAIKTRYRKGRPVVRPTKADRQQAVAIKKAAQQQAAADKKAQREQAQAARQQATADKKAARNAQKANPIDTPPQTDKQ